MEIKDENNTHFEFAGRRALTETAPQRAACWYDSADQLEEEVSYGADYFDLNILPD